MFDSIYIIVFIRGSITASLEYSPIHKGSWISKYILELRCFLSKLSTKRCTLILNEYKYKKSAKAQWSWMTKKLRGYVGIMKGRACYTCQSCAVSAAQQDLLLLEVKRIIPVAKGWLSVEDNLQTFCWKCNRRNHIYPNNWKLVFPSKCKLFH